MAASELIWLLFLTFSSNHQADCQILSIRSIFTLLSLASFLQWFFPEVAPKSNTLQSSIHCSFIQIQINFVVSLYRIIHWKSQSTMLMSMPKILSKIAVTSHHDLPLVRLCSKPNATRLTLGWMHATKLLWHLLSVSASDVSVQHEAGIYRWILPPSWWKLFPISFPVCLSGAIIAYRLCKHAKMILWNGDNSWQVDVFGYENQWWVWCKGWPL